MRSARESWFASSTSFRIAAGDRIGLVGRNGAGKTTLTKTLAGETQPTDGLISRAGDIGYLPQDPRTGDLDTLALDRVDVIEASAADIFAKCKLAPTQDAVLHGMLVPLLAAVQKFKADPRDMAQLAVMREAVAGYPRYFDAPDWTSEAMHMH